MVVQTQFHAPEKFGVIMFIISILMGMILAGLIDLLVGHICLFSFCLNNLVGIGIIVFGIN